ncbi:uncharacterized protein [Tenebrio molitor]|uniref:uncharacterized protein isoform X1 n=2 Tax=Tenebrio molitor TaxID=7067 RepID=UPI0036249F9D
MTPQVSSLFITNTNNLSSKDWFLSDTDDIHVLSIPLDASESGFFNGNFVPPPPRPLFLDEGVTSDGLTTCDLCSWAWQNGNSYNMDIDLERSSELGWLFTLVIVSLVSAVVGAVIMITVLQCKRLKKSNNINGVEQRMATQLGPHRPPISIPDDKFVNVPSPQNFQCDQNVNGVWSWLSRRSTTTSSQLQNPSSFVENHYTHMEDSYNSVGDALYTELDIANPDSRDKNSPAYQNSAYMDPDAPVSSAPSSAYYSDLSVTTIPDRAYEVVGLSTIPVWDSSSGNEIKKPATVKLAVISENITVPSDYV